MLLFSFGQSFRSGLSHVFQQRQLLGDCHLRKRIGVVSRAACTPEVHTDNLKDLGRKFGKPVRWNGNAGIPCTDCQMPRFIGVKIGTSGVPRLYWLKALDP